jgi:hypothetical protein
MRPLEGFQTFDQACVVGGKYDRAAAPCVAFINNAVGEFVADQNTRKNSAMENVLHTANRVFDADMATSMALIRSNDVKASQEIINDLNSRVEGSLKHDVDLTRRQFEINEYHYYNKLDTLFFLQVFFIAVLVMIIMIYFNRRGYLTTNMTGVLTALLAVLLVIIGVSRYFYTIRTRDRRLWHRRHFQTEKDPAPPLVTTCPGAPSSTETVINLNALFSTGQVQCAMDANENNKKWLKEMNAEAAHQMASGNRVESIFASIGPNKPDSCKRS